MIKERPVQGAAPLAAASVHSQVERHKEAALHEPAPYHIHLSTGWMRRGIVGARPMPYAFEPEKPSKTA